MKAEERADLENRVGCLPRGAFVRFVLDEVHIAREGDTVFYIPYKGEELAKVGGHLLTSGIDCIGGDYIELVNWWVAGAKTPPEQSRHMRVYIDAISVYYPPGQEAIHLRG